MASAKVPLLSDEDDTIQFGEEDDGASNKNRKPYVTFFHLFFRVSAIVVYNFCGFFTSSYIASFVIVILLLSMDFWTVKNVTGRLLVGLRWWNYVDETGKSHWVFESKKTQQNRGNSSEARIFWTALVIVPVIWIMLFIAALFSFNFRWLVLVCIAIVLSSANLYAYFKCRVGSNTPITTSLSNMSSSIFRQVIVNTATMMSKPQQQPSHPSVI